MAVFVDKPEGWFIYMTELWKYSSPNPEMLIYLSMTAL